MDRGAGHPHVRLDIDFEGRQQETARQHVEVSTFSLIGGRKSGLVGAMGATQDFPEEQVSREVRQALKKPLQSAGFPCRDRRPGNA
ncbi:hypothetical protein NicSoilC12_00470 [Arthrobacter sp. NicSoilC12]|nr:hypothetical protein NicSoilC12_00470 [Arthrobacter sp. NicSoilC12]